MKKIFAIMFSIVMMAVCGNDVKAQTNDAQQNYEVTGSLTSSSRKKLHKTYQVELFQLSDGKSEYVAYQKVKGSDDFKFNLHSEGAYKVKVFDNDGNLVMGRVFSIDKVNTTKEIGQFDVATGTRVTNPALQANKE